MAHIFPNDAGLYLNKNFGLKSDLNPLNPMLLSDSTHIPEAPG